MLICHTPNIEIMLEIKKSEAVFQHILGFSNVCLNRLPMIQDVEIMHHGAPMVLALPTPPRADRLLGETGGISCARKPPLVIVPDF